jgi:hypothetical protein
LPDLRRSVNTPRQIATENPMARTAATTTAIKKKINITGSKNTDETVARRRRSADLARALSWMRRCCCVAADRDDQKQASLEEQTAGLRGVVGQPPGSMLPSRQGLNGSKSR